MRCINRPLASCLSLMLCILLLTGCAARKTEFSNHYNLYGNTDITNINADSDSGGAQITYFSENLCVGGVQNLGLDTVNSQIAQGAGVFCLATGEIPYAQNIYERMYPASTTKILTAYIALTYGNPDDVVTISENAVTLDDASSVCGVAAGDQMSLRDLVYGLMLRSGNDAAIAIAEHISGSTEAFAEIMNREAYAMGATGSHFVNPNGLPDENHYTTVYDMYLIFQTAILNPDFCEIIRTTEYTTNYILADGTENSMTWGTTNRYQNGQQTAPEGITVIGGKTGTTGDAGHCLVLLSVNDEGEQIISIIFKADSRGNLYLLMNELLEKYGIKGALSQNT